MQLSLEYMHILSSIYLPVLVDLESEDLAKEWWCRRFVLLPLHVYPFLCRGGTMITVSGAGFDAVGMATLTITAGIPWLITYVDGSVNRTWENRSFTSVMLPCCSFVFSENCGKLILLLWSGAAC